MMAIGLITLGSLAAWLAWDWALDPSARGKAVGPVRTFSEAESGRVILSGRVPYRTARLIGWLLARVTGRVIRCHWGLKLSACMSLVPIRTR